MFIPSGSVIPTSKNYVQGKDIHHNLTAVGNQKLLKHPVVWIWLNKICTYWIMVSKQLMILIFIKLYMWACISHINIQGKRLNDFTYVKIKRKYIFIYVNIYVKSQMRDTFQTCAKDCFWGWRGPRKCNFYCFCIFLETKGLHTLFL